MYWEKGKLSREEFIKRFIDVDPKLYEELKSRGYKFYSGSAHNLADGLAQRCIYGNNGDKLYFINVWCYVYDDRFVYGLRKVATTIEADFYLNDDDDKRCTVQFSNGNLDFCEKFFASMFYEYRCRVYEKAN